MTEVLGGNAQQMIRSTVERILKLEEEKAAVNTDIKELYLEAKGNGLDPRMLRKVVRLAKMDEQKRAEEIAVLDSYIHSLGFLE